VSADRLATIRTLYDAMNRRDLDALRDAPELDPDFRWEGAHDEPDPQERRGSDDSLARVRELLEVFDVVEVGVEDVIELDAEHAIFLVNLDVRGATSGARSTRREAHLWTVREGRLASLREFPTVDEARRAAR
jgi:ketosteroid isomerase-like protein